MGIGHRLKNDDAFGSLLGEELANHLVDNENFRAIDCGTTPQNFLKPAAEFNPDVVLLVDAVRLPKQAGDLILVKPEEVSLTGFSTHNFSPAFLFDKLKERTGAEIKILCLIPQSTATGTELTEVCRKSYEELLNYFLDFPPFLFPP